VTTYLYNKAASRRQHYLQNPGETNLSKQGKDLETIKHILQMNPTKRFIFISES
jgi:hypothetical protein